jgi:hypothetical protein
MLLVDVAYNRGQTASHSHVILLLEELIFDLKAGGSQTYFKQLRHASTGKTERSSNA